MKQVTQFQSDAGNTFANEHDAHKDDLRHVLTQLADNAAIADKIVQALTPDTRKKLLVALDHLAQRDNEPELPMPQNTVRGLRLTPFTDDWGTPTSGRFSERNIDRYHPVQR